ncbi:MAG: RNA methyltransferase [Bacteroidales bacterium]|nr:RNA methyltransferase [Bacteroidales bacterium]
MISKQRISDIRKLYQKKYREAEQLFLVEGRKSVEMLLSSDFEVEEVLTTEAFQNRYPTLFSGHAVTMGTSADLERISGMSTAPEVLAIARQKRPTPPSPSGDQPLLLLDRISDPGNMGTIIRTADWFNIKQIVCSPDCVEFYNPKTIQSTMGSFCYVEVSYLPLVPYLQEASRTRRVLGTFMDGQPLSSFTPRQNDILVIGNESNGITPEVAALITDRITIAKVAPGRPSAESLNAAIAAGITMHEIFGK